ncbi:hypothetical protein JW948_17665 [bacterium]|nr:hypothetical protein [bacterium]
MRKFGFILMHFTAVMIMAQPAPVPLDHWVYNFLDRLTAKGVLDPLNGTFPYTRQQVADALGRVQNSLDAGARLTAAENERFEQLKDEFHDDLPAGDVPLHASGTERHFLSWSEGGNRACADLILDQKIFAGSGKNQKTVSQTTGGGMLRGSITRHFGYHLYTYSTLRKGENLTQERFDPSQGMPVTISGKNAFSDDASATFIYERSRFYIELGRSEAAWGPGRRGQLMLSRHEAFFDMLRLQYGSRRFQFTSIHGKLNMTPGPKFIAAHRLELRVFPWLLVAGSESVIYGNRDVEPMYLNPLMPYHVAEHHLGDRDNNTMALDITLYPNPGHKLSMEFFLDDFTTSENPLTYYGNKWALLTGWRWVDPFGLDGWDVQAEYARIEPYVYTHDDSINVYKEYGRPIGHWLGPDSDHLYLGIGLLAARSLDLTLSFSRTRHGQGDINTPPDPSVTTRKHFLSGTVESVRETGCSVRWQWLRDCFMTVRYAYRNTENRDNVPGASSNTHQFTGQLSVNY